MKKTILIVEDEAIIAQEETDYLSSHGYNVRQVYNGEEALWLFRKNNEIIDLVIMDINLGNGIDGISTAHEIFKIKKVPLIFHSSYPESTVSGKLQNLTYHSYIEKGSDKELLLEMIRTALMSELDKVDY